jgi:hypothetical protein
MNEIAVAMNKPIRRSLDKAINWLFATREFTRNEILRKAPPKIIKCSKQTKKAFLSDNDKFFINKLLAKIFQHIQELKLKNEPKLSPRNS